MIAVGRSLATWSAGRVLLIIGAALGIGTVVSFSPVLGFSISVAIPLALILAHSAFVRASVVIAGGLVVFQTSSDVSVEKVAYLAVVMVAVTLALNHIRRQWQDARKVGTAPLLVAAAAVAAVIASSSVVAAARGTTLTAWALDTPAYWLLVAGIVLGVDLGVSQSESRWIAAVLFISGTMAAIGFSAAWWDRRHLVAVPIGHLFFPSLFLPGAAIALAAARIFAGFRPVAMATLITLLLAALLATGTRSALILTAPVLIAFAVAKGRRRMRFLPALLVGLVVTAVVSVALGSFADAGELDLGAIQARLATVASLASSRDFASDPSLYQRTVETTYLVNEWTSSIWFGIGPGRPYITPTSGVLGVAVDSPVALLARYGILGALAFAALLIVLLLGQLRRKAAWTASTALLGFVLTIVCWSLVSSPFDDKGVALGLIPLIALAARQRQSLNVEASMLRSSTSEPHLGQA